VTSSAESLTDDRGLTGKSAPKAMLVIIIGSVVGFLIVVVLVSMLLALGLCQASKLYTINKI